MALVTAMAIHQPAHSQDENEKPASDQINTGEIIVTAQRREQRLQDVPLSVSVTSGAQLNQSNIVSLQDLSTRLPNIRISSAPGAGLLNVRGVGSGLNPGFEQSVGTFVDGVYRGRSRAVAAALFDLDRVEVLRGPQTTFFGNNTIAGALNITTRKPEDSFDYNASALYGPTDGEYALEAGVTGPLTPTLSARVAAKAFGRDGYVRSRKTGEDSPHQRDFVTRASLHWSPGDILVSDLRVDYGRIRDRGSLPNELAGCPADPAIWGAPRGVCARALAAGPVDDQLDGYSDAAENYNHYRFVEVAATNRLQLGEYRLTSITSYFNHRSDFLSDAAPVPVTGTGGTASPFELQLGERLTQYTQELRLDSPTDKPFRYSVGGYYSHGSLQITNYAAYFFGPFGAFAAPTYNATTPIMARGIFDQHDRSLSAFASASYDITSALTVNAGLRYSVVRKEIFARDWQYGSGTTPIGPDTFVLGPPSVQTPLYAVLGGQAGNFASPVRTDKKLMPSVNVQYKFSDALSGYASFTKGFKAGGYGASGPNKDSFGPETVNAFEIGLKGSAFDRRLTFDADIFRSNYDDLQEQTNRQLPSGAIIPVLANVAKARSQGVEINATLRASRHLSLNSSVAYLDAKYQQYPNAPCTLYSTLFTPNCTQDLSGKRRSFAPEWSGSAGADWTIPVSPELEGHIQPTVYFTTSYFQAATADPVLSQDGYAKLDLRLAIGSPTRGWEFAIIAKNLTDKRTGSFRNAVPGTAGTYYIVAEPPRTVAFQISFK